MTDRSLHSDAEIPPTAGGQSRPLALTTGYITLDIVTRDRQLSHFAGGTAGNVAANLAWLAVRSAILGRIGEDHAGRFLSSDLASMGVDIAHLHRDRIVDTPLVVHEIQGDGRHKFNYSCPICSRRLPRARPIRDEHVLEAVESLQPSLFFFDRASSAAILAADVVRSRGGIVMFEPNTRGRLDIGIRAAAIADVIKVSNQRVRVVGDAVLDSRPNQLQIVTLGSKGFRWRIGNGEWHTKQALEGRIVDAGGAGDWMTAGVLSRLISEAPIARIDSATAADALDFGQALATLSCSFVGARGLATAMRPAEAVAMARRLLSSIQEIDCHRNSVVATSKRARGKCRGCLQPAGSLVAGLMLVEELR